MNETGGPVKALATFYKVPVERVVASTTSSTSPSARCGPSSAAATTATTACARCAPSLGTGDFYRVRVGIGRPPGRQDVADFVLSNYSAAERKDLPFQVDDAADAVESLVTDGLEKTQQRFNS